MNDTTEDQEAHIRRKAYEIWEAEGRPQGRSEEFWHRARAAVEAHALSGSLDEQLAETFPGSDVPTLTNPSATTVLPKPPEDEPAPANSATLEERPTEPARAKASRPKAAPKAAAMAPPKAAPRGRKRKTES